MDNIRDEAQALQSFWESFGIPAVDEQSAYDEDTLEQLGISFPYITYEAAISSFDEPVSLGADLWYNTTSWKEITKKAKMISDAIGLGGKLIPYRDGAIWITRGSVFSRRMAAEVGYDVRRIHININAEFLSA